MLKDTANLPSLKMIQYELSKVYLVYFDNLLQVYSSNTIQGKKIFIAKQKTQKAIRIVGRALGAGGTAITKSELKQLHSLVREVNVARDEFTDYVRATKEERVEIDKIEEEVDINKEDIKITEEMVQKVVDARIKEIKKPTKIREKISGGFRKGLGYKPLMYGGVGYYGQELISSLAGPYGAPLGAITGLGVLGARVLRRYRQRRHEEPGIPTIQPEISVTEPGIPTPTIPTPGLIPAPKYGAFRARTRRQKEEASEPLFYFFDKRAHKASWTRDVLQALKGRRVGKVAGVGGVGGVEAGFAGGIGAGITSLVLKGAVTTYVLGAATFLGLSIADVIKKWPRALEGEPVAVPPTVWEKYTPLGAIQYIIREKLRSRKMKELYPSPKPPTKTQPSVGILEKPLPGEIMGKPITPTLEQMLSAGIPLETALRVEKEGLKTLPEIPVPVPLPEKTPGGISYEAIERIVRTLEKMDNKTEQQIELLKKLMETLEKRGEPRSMVIPSGAIPENPWQSVGQAVDAINAGVGG